MKATPWLLMFSMLLFAATSSKAQNIYVVQNRDSADVAVYAITDSTMADLWVYAGSSGGNTDNNGIWNYTSSPAGAKKIFYTSVINDAEVWLFFVSDQRLAGWRNMAKPYLLN